MTNELYSNLVCALTHDLHVCEECQKCQGKNCGEIRLNLIKELAEQENKVKPWKETDNGNSVA